jgi:2-amino-4-hydroxy-6-hydroxymethyldihydropteridine diphosphokinase
VRRRTFVALGANLGDPMRTLAAALESLPGLVAVSNLYETEPVGGPPGQPRYLNAVAELASEAGPFALLDELLAIEARHGRVRLVPNGPRTLDLDIIWMDGVLVSSPPRLVVPHPRAALRPFVLWPLADLDPELAERLAAAPLASLARPTVVAWARGSTWFR